jgi:cardiolipin synthase A/B
MQFENAILGAALAALGALLSGLAIGHALLHKRLPQSAFGWIAVSLTFPFIGPMLYFLFGINRVRTRAKKLRADQHVQEQPDSPAAPSPAGFEPLAQLGWATAESPLVEGNRVEVLHNGEQAFPAMLEAIEQASRRVLLSTYIFETNRTGQDFAAGLGRAAARGVDVRVLIDGVGELYSFPRASRLLARLGVRVERFLPPRLLPPSFHVNLRNHRKILCVDGHTAFTGGMNIGDRYLAANTANPHRVVDMHFRLRGPIVAHVEAAFAHDWQFVTGETIMPSGTPIEHVGDAACRTVLDGPDEDLDRLTTLLLGAMSIARRRIAIMTPYFLPPRELIGALQAAAARHVDVAVILPARNNLPYVHRATRHMLWELLQRGVKVYYQPAPFVHSKLLLIDERYAQIGSANLDPRSLRLNFELTVEVYDRRFVEDLGAHFAAVRRHSAPVTLDVVDRRRLHTRLADGLAWLFTPYL